MRVQKGTYDLSLEGYWSACFEPNNVPLMPCNAGVVASQVSITEDTALILDVKVAKLSGAVTLNGGPLPDSLGQRGPLVFFRKGNSTDQGLKATPLGMTGPANYNASMWPGEYEVWWTDEDSGCEEGEGPSQLPCAGGYLTTVSVTGDQVLDVDIRTVNVTGKVSYGEASLPATADHGVVVFTLQGASRAASGTANVDTPVVGEYSISLIPGTYAVGYQGGGTCDASVEPAVVCASEGLLTCAPDAPSAGDTLLSVRPPALPGTVTPPVVDPIDPDPDPDPDLGPSALEMVLGCQMMLDNAIACTAGTDQGDLFTASVGFCDVSYGDRYAACDTAETTLSRAIECSNAPCEEATDCTTLGLTGYALCRQ
jgi:hypothetical protein